jgi:hypothetical protein
MQGSHLGLALHGQDYRRRLKKLLSDHFPHAEIYDPLADHGESLAYGEDRGRQVFFYHNRMCAEVDVLVAYVPEASMGTAIEMWEAYRHGRAVVTISPLKHNWAVRFLSHELYADLDEFEQALADGRLALRLAELLAEPGHRCGGAPSLPSVGLPRGPGQRAGEPGSRGD